MSNTLVAVSGFLIFADCVLCILIFHRGMMKTASPDTAMQGCALLMALGFIYGALLVCVLLLLKNDMYPFIQRHTELCLTVSLTMMFVLLACLGSRISGRSRYTMSEIDKMDGKTFEKACAEILRYNGFSQVEITGRSGDGGVDILAYKGSVRYAVQCKRYKNKLGNSSIQEVFSGKAYYHCDKAVVMTNSYFTRPAIKYAENLNVELWDRDYLSQQLSVKA